MNNSLQCLSFEGQSIRVISDHPSGELWFIAKDAAEILGYRDASNMVRNVPAEDKGTHIVSTPSGIQKMAIISESSVYTAAVLKRGDATRRFRRWVTHDVLPSIRQTGSYSVPGVPAVPALDISDLATQRQFVLGYLATLDRAESAEQQLALAAPMMQAHNAFMGATNEYDVKDAAQFLRNQTGIKIGRNNLFRWLREEGWISPKDDRPYQHYSANGLLRLKVYETPYRRPDRTLEYPDPQLRITPKGLTKIHRDMTTAGQKAQVPAVTARPKRNRRSLNP